MYNVLIIGDEKIQNIQEHHKLKKIRIDQSIKELKEKEYDLIFLSNEEKTNLFKENVLTDYMLLPKELKKLAINNVTERTYINIQIINELILNNIDIIQFKNYYERITIALVLKQFLIGETNLKKIYNNICPKELKEKDINNTVDKVVKRDYSLNSTIRMFKYFIYRKKIKRKFFENIYVNIKQDINKLQNL